MPPAPPPPQQSDHSCEPSPMLRGHVGALWRSDSAAQVAGTREHVLPTGQMHLVFRLSGPALRLYRGPDDAVGTLIKGPVVGGPRHVHYVKEVGAPVVSVGVQLLPGAAQALFGVSAAELAGGHTPLSSLWGAQADSALQRIAEAGSPQQQLAALDAVLRARLQQRGGLQPEVALALAKIDQGLPVEAIVRDSRYSHRGLIALFRNATGHSPKRYARLMRFQALLAALNDAKAGSLSELALAAGYADQAHMNREFRQFAGLTPAQYRALGPLKANHVVLPQA